MEKVKQEYEIQTKIDNIIKQNRLELLINNEQDPRRSLFETDELREFTGLVYLKDINPDMEEDEKKEFICRKTA